MHSKSRQVISKNLVFIIQCIIVLWHSRFNKSGIKIVLPRSTGQFLIFTRCFQGLLVRRRIGQRKLEWEVWAVALSMSHHNELRDTPVFFPFSSELIFLTFYPSHFDNISYFSRNLGESNPSPDTSISSMIFWKTTLTITSSGSSVNLAL